MNVTISLDEDLRARLEELAEERGTFLEESVNFLLREVLPPRPQRMAQPRKFKVRTRPMHPKPGVDWDNLKKYLYGEY